MTTRHAIGRYGIFRFLHDIPLTIAITMVDIIVAQRLKCVKHDVGAWTWFAVRCR
jgi:hypothetical protein